MVQLKPRSLGSISSQVLHSLPVCHRPLQACLLRVLHELCLVPSCEGQVISYSLEFVCLVYTITTFLRIQKLHRYLDEHLHINEPVALHD